jgi:hypothetical protein
MFHRFRKSLDIGRGAVSSSSGEKLVEIKDVGISVVRSVGFRGALGLWKLANFPLQIQGDRPNQEDRHIALGPGCLNSNKNIALYAVFDGQYATSHRDSKQMLTFIVVQGQLCPNI